MAEARPWAATVVESGRGLEFASAPDGLDEVVAAAAQWGARPLLIEGDEQRSFADVVDAAGAVAAELAGRGIGRGDRVMLLGANSSSWVIAFLGILRSGAAAVLANGWWSASDVAGAIDRTAPALVVVDGRRADRVPESAPTVDLGALVTAASRAATAVQAPAGALAPVTGRDPALVVFTSGTTSEPRGVVLSHRAVVANLHNVLHRTRQLPPLPADAPGTTSLCALPLFHLSGVQTLLTHLVSGGTIVMTVGRFDPVQVLDLLERHAVQTWAAVPTMLTLVLDAAEASQRSVGALRSLAVGGAPVAPALLERSMATFPNAAARLAHSYGSTEAGGTVGTGLRLPDGTDAVAPLATVEVRVRDADESGVGEILVRSPAVMDGYLGLAPHEQPVDADGWLATGDLGRLDAAGNLELTGRAKDIVIRGGENVSAAYVESVLHEHPGVAEAAVVGAAHPVLGEEVAAVVRARPGCTVTAAELEAFLATRLASFAVPSRWAFLDGPLPTNASGKVAKAEVRALFAPVDDPLVEGVAR